MPKAQSRTKLEKETIKYLRRQAKAIARRQRRQAKRDAKDGEDKGK